jgi:hypothetical protein
LIGATVEIWVCVIIDRRFLNYTQFSSLYIDFFQSTEAFFVTWCRLFAYFDVRSRNSNYLNVNLILYLRNWFIIKCRCFELGFEVWKRLQRRLWLSCFVFTSTFEIFLRFMIFNGFLKFKFHSFKFFDERLKN